MTVGDRVSFQNTSATGTIVKVTSKDKFFFEAKEDTYTVEWDDGYKSSDAYYRRDLHLI